MSTFLECDAPECTATTSTEPGRTGRDWHTVITFPHRAEETTRHACSPAHVIAIMHDINPGLHVAHRIHEDVQR